MPFAHKQASIEESPEQHDSEAVIPGSTEADVEAILQLAQTYRVPGGPLLDIACGSGRHVRAFQEHRESYGCDIDERMIAKATKASVQSNRYSCVDASDQDLDWVTCTDGFAIITLLNRSLVCFHAHDQAWGLFKNVARLLKPGGIFVIDNCCSILWQQVKEGLFADGLSEDGQEQLIFLPGENRFTWRRGSAVDPDNWEITENDRLYRLWSLNELALAAAGAGLASPLLNNDTQFLVLQRPEE